MSIMSRTEPALLLGAAAAALLLLGRKSGNATAEATLGSGVATTGGGADPEATITVVQWGDLWAGATGTGLAGTDQWSPGGEQNPIEWPVANIGDRLEIRGAPDKSYMVAFTADNAGYIGVDESVAIVPDPANGSLTLESINGLPVGPMYIKHTDDRIRYIYVNG